jgi:DNA invertase Pin-like site-specific DNA recombinase
VTELGKELLRRRDTDQRARQAFLALVADSGGGPFTLSDLDLGMFALMAEYEAALIRERTQAGLAAARSRGLTGGRKPKMTPELINKAQRMYDARQFTMAEIAASCGVTPMTIYRNIRTSHRGTPLSAAP